MIKNKKYHLKCLNCNQAYQPHEIGYFCPTCRTQGALDVVFDYDVIRREWSKDDLRAAAGIGMWRYAQLLPATSASCVPPLHVGDTPLYRFATDAGGFGRLNVLIKDDSRQPTGSLKDRASALAVAIALEQGATTVAVASTGNAGRSQESSATFS